MNRFGLLCNIFTLSLVASGIQAAEKPPATQAAQYWPLLEQYCADCHNFEDWAGGVAFDTMLPENVPADAEVWESAVRKLRGRLMPPPGHPQPEQSSIDGFVGWMESYLDTAAHGAKAGHVPIQRMNRTEYALAVQGLLGVEIDPADYLPTDMEVDGFDNIAAALTISPAFLDQYIGVAREVAHLAIGENAPKVSSAYFQSKNGDQDDYVAGMPPGTRGGMSIRHTFPADGEYRFNVLDLDVGLYPRSVETEHTLVVLVDDREIFRGSLGGRADLDRVDHGGADGRAEIMRRFANIPAQVTAGIHNVTVTFIERSRAETDELIGGFQAYGGFSFQGALRAPRVLDGIEIIGPFNATGVSPTASRQKIFVCQPESVETERSCAEKITTNLARRAFRRPVSDEDVAALMAFYDRARESGGDFERGIEQAVTAVLVSPDFLFRAIAPPSDLVDDEIYALSDLELASRLSYFLWSQGPDSALIELAEQGRLKEPAVLREQVLRMLADPRASTLVTNFALKWLNLDDLTPVDPDPRIFPGFSEQMRADFTEEMVLFMSSIMLEDRSVLDLLTADHTFVNESLARLYGIDGVFGPQFRRVTVADSNRRGILGKGATLLRTSYGDRTSPVLRGAWVLDKLMGTPPAPPPPNVETDLSTPPGEKPKTVRARLESHRDKPGCNECHGVIDPIGFSLENLDVIGRWRDVDRESGDIIDATTVLPNGTPVAGPAQLRNVLVARPDQFVQALTEKLMMYALNRELEYYDMPQVREIVRNAVSNGYRMASIVLGIVASDAFQMQALPHTDNESKLQVAAVPAATDNTRGN